MNVMEKRTRNKLTMARIIGSGVAIPAIIAGGVWHFSDTPEENDIQISLPEKQIRADNSSLSREAFSAKIGSQFDSIGLIQKDSGVCTVIDLGRGFAVSAAHCFSDSARPTENQPLGGITSIPIAFGCDPIERNIIACEIFSEIKEVAIPKQFDLKPNFFGIVYPYYMGNDIAFIRHEPRVSKRLTQNFEIKSGFQSDDTFTQIGYGGDQPGLTGANCSWADDDTLENSQYVITTNCVAKKGDSGGPLLTQNNEIVGILSAGNIDEEVGAFYTPITPDLLEAFEQFQRGHLDGETTTLDTGTPALLFDYKRVEVAPQP